MDESAHIANIARFCTQNELPWSDQIRRGFATYLQLLAHFNESMNLIGPMSPADIVDHLLIDSAAAAAVAAPAGSILDVGTGAGLPGIPLKLLFPDCPLTLVEPRQKRATFLEIARARLALEATAVERTRLQDWRPVPADIRFDYVISKAFEAPTRWMDTAQPWVTDDGVVVCLGRPGQGDAVEQHAGAAGLQMISACADTTRLGAPPVGQQSRAVFVIGRPGSARP